MLCITHTERSSTHNNNNNTKREAIHTTIIIPTCRNKEGGNTHTHAEGKEKKDSIHKER
jgi:hypothetical protein